MKVKVVTLENKAAGEIELDDAIFGLPARVDILQRVVEWQRARKRQGTHKTKGISEISGTTRKPWKQKGTGRARAGSMRAPQFRGGATIFGPVVRDHSYDLPKKVRKLGLKTALSVKAAEGKLQIIDNVNLKDQKTKALTEQFSKMGFTSALFIDGKEVNQGFALATRNIPGVDVLPTQGANVYDILRHDALVLTKDAVKQLEERLK